MEKKSEHSREALQVVSIDTFGSDRNAPMFSEMLINVNFYLKKFFCFIR